MLTTCPTTEPGLEVTLLQALDNLAECHPDDLPGDLADLAEALEGAHVDTFAQAGVLTRDAGLVLRLANGAEFQITIVQSASAR